MTAPRRLAPLPLLHRIARAASTGLARASGALHPQPETRAVARGRLTAVSVKVALALLVTTDCAAQGAVCTGDGRKLSNRLEFTVSGPGG